MVKNKRIKEIEEELELYQVKGKLANAMLKCGELGFEFSGHGAGCGSEHFGLLNQKANLYVAFDRSQSGLKVWVSSLDDEPKSLLEKASLERGMKYIEKAVKALK